MNNFEKQNDISLEKADSYAHAVYKLAQKLPKEELYGLSSQLKRAALSIPLNIVEGYARQSVKSHIQFLTIAYGSLKEAQYTIGFALEEKYFSKEEAETVRVLGEEIAKLLWSRIQTLRKSLS